MKKFVMVIMVFVFIVGCKKSETTPSAQLLFGTWELCKQQCLGPINYPSGTGGRLTFYENGKFISMGSLQDTSSYYLSFFTYPTGEKVTLLHLNGHLNSILEMLISNDTLSLYPHNPGYSDACSSYYKKL